MNNKCGLVNKQNPCRCAKKTKSFVEAGYVNPHNLLFYPKYKMFVEQSAVNKQEEMEEGFYSEYRALYQKHTLLSIKELAEEINKILTSPKVKALFNLE